MKRNSSTVNILLLATLILIAGSCSNTKYLSDSQQLYIGSKTFIISDSGKFKDRNARSAILSVTSYKPNNAIAGKRLLPPFGLWIHNYLKPADNRKPGWFYRTFSHEPVLISTVEPELRSRKLESELFGNGYFRSNVGYEIVTSRRNPQKASIIYRINPGMPYRYSDILFSPPMGELDSIINSFEDELIIRPDDIFSLGKVQSEAKRITAGVLEEGYFYFNPGHIKWSADTTIIPYRIEMTLGKNNEQLQDAGIKYKIGKIYVVVSGPDDPVLTDLAPDTLYYEGLFIISDGTLIKPEIISTGFKFRTGDIYSAVRHQETIAHLGNYGVFKFINIQYTPDPDTSLNLMDVRCELTLMRNINLDLEANAVTKSTGFTGPGIEIKLSHGNLSDAANRLQVTLDGNIEWQKKGGSGSTSLGDISYGIGISSSLMLPRILKPPRLFRDGRYLLPQTSLTIGMKFLNKVQYYRMSSSNLSFAYRWKTSDKFTNILYPIYFNSVDLLKTTSDFDSILTENPVIRRSFEEQFISGVKYDLIFDSNISDKPHGFYFMAGVSTSATLIDLFNRAISPEEDRPYKILNNVYSQFFKITSDLRYYRYFGGHAIAIRFYSGIGIPYSNSVVMPYVEQFYSGGSNSIRAFVARAVGPGALKPDETSDLFDQTGDIKLEGNIEYRFKLSKVINGAVFADAGNIWLLNADANRPGAEFSFSTFPDQLYIGTGFGLRFDFSFFVLRTDIGIPLRTAFSVNNSNWIIADKTRPVRPVFNLAIGYPF